MELNVSLFKTIKCISCQNYFQRLVGQNTIFSVDCSQMMKKLMVEEPVMPSHNGRVRMFQVKANAAGIF